MSLTAAITGRVKGFVPISIASALAMESLCGIGEFQGKGVKLLEYNTVYISLHTIYRNLIGAIDKSNHSNLSPKVLQEYIAEELLVIDSLIESISNKVKVIFYHRDYTNLAHSFPLAKLKTPRTDKQFLALELEQKTLKSFLSNEFLHHDLRIKTFKDSISGKGLRAVILTHHSVDLLDRPNFVSLTLLESHTGTLKTSNAWNTKLTKTSGIERIPFNRLTIQVLGDKSTDFLSLGIKTKRDLLDLSKKGKWKPNTTKDKIRYTLNKFKDIESVELFKSML